MSEQNSAASTAGALWYARYLENDKQARKEAPLARGLFGYFPNACLHVAHVSFVANAQHNPGLPMQWAFNKSSDEPDCELRHMLDAMRAGGAGESLTRAEAFDDDGLLHLAKKAWRSMADLERYVLTHYPKALPGASVTGFVAVGVDPGSEPGRAVHPITYQDWQRVEDSLAVLP